MVLWLILFNTEALKAGVASGAEEKNTLRRIPKFTDFLKLAFDVSVVNFLTISNQEEIVARLYHFHVFARQRCVVNCLAKPLAFIKSQRFRRTNVEGFWSRSVAARAC